MPRTSWIFVHYTTKELELQRGWSIIAPTPQKRHPRFAAVWADVLTTSAFVQGIISISLEQTT
jgi:hypothetical protein